MLALREAELRTTARCLLEYIERSGPATDEVIGRFCEASNIPDELRRRAIEYLDRNLDIITRLPKSQRVEIEAGGAEKLAISS